MNPTLIQTNFNSFSIREIRDSFRTTFNLFQRLINNNFNTNLIRIHLSIRDPNPNQSDRLSIISNPFPQFESIQTHLLILFNERPQSKLIKNRSEEKNL